MHEVIQPPGWVQPKGYANGMTGRGRLVFVAGQIGWDAQGAFTSDGLVGQTRQALLNVVTVLRAAGAEPHHLVSLTWYLVDRQDYLAQASAIGQVYREVIGRHFPTMAAVQVAGLIEQRAKVEIQAIAVVPDLPAAA